MRKHCRNNLNLLLDNASHYSPPDPGFVIAGGKRDEDISDLSKGAIVYPLVENSTV